ncbi:MAG: YdcF family protein, partial [Pseudomonadota bacterium]
MMLVVVVLFAVWLVGLFNFASRVVALEVPGDQQTDAIVALTGELVRLREGIALLKDEQSERLFISGVYRGVDVEELLAVLREDA